MSGSQIAEMYHAGPIVFVRKRHQKNAGAYVAYEKCKRERERGRDIYFKLL